VKRRGRNAEDRFRKIRYEGYQGKARGRAKERPGRIAMEGGHGRKRGTSGMEYRKDDMVQSTLRKEMK